MISLMHRCEEDALPDFRAPFLRFTSRRFSVDEARIPLSGRRERLSASVTYSQIDKLLHVFKFDHDGQ